MLLDSALCNFGWNAIDFTLPDVHGGDVNMQKSIGENGLLIAFICNHCPYVKAIGHRLVSDAKLLIADGVNVLAIMSNDYNAYPSDSPEKMKVFAKEYGFTFPYLVDEDQSVAKAYQAICTPDFFGFNNQGELQYRGRLDSAKMGDSVNREPVLLNAMRMIAKTGKGPKEQTASIGCSIKWR